VPFAGHPNVGTAVVLAHDLVAKGGPPVDRMVFEEAAGLVPIHLLRESGAVVGAEFTAPKQLSLGASISAEEAAECLSILPSEIRTEIHGPQVLSVGLAFLVAEVTTREVLRRCKPSMSAHERVLPSNGTDSIYAYVRGAAEGELHARMFAPIDATAEDPATGSAAAATIALLALRRPERDAEVAWRIEQGVDMGRPSLLLGRTVKRDGKLASVHVAGNAVQVMHGFLSVPAGS
jgi:trans-2,3-dihydro-3-hydroxyanthranilate isomerase